MTAKLELERKGAIRCSWSADFILPSRIFPGEKLGAIKLLSWSEAGRLKTGFVAFRSPLGRSLWGSVVDFSRIFLLVDGTGNLQAWQRQFSSFFPWIFLGIALRISLCYWAPKGTERGTKSNSSSSWKRNEKRNCYLNDSLKKGRSECLVQWRWKTIWFLAFFRLVDHRYHPKIWS